MANQMANQNPTKMKEIISKDDLFEYLNVESDFYVDKNHFSAFSFLLSVVLKKKTNLNFDFYPISYLFCVYNSPSFIKSIILWKGPFNPTIVSFFRQLIFSRQRVGFGLDLEIFGLSILENLPNTYQDGLNVKRFRNQKGIVNEGLIPKLGSSLNSDFENFTWFRIKYSSNTDFEKYNADRIVFLQPQDERYLELYFQTRKKNMKVFLDNICNQLHSDENVEKIVFCSNLRYIKDRYNYPIVFGQIFAFFSCYYLQKNDIPFDLNCLPKLISFQILSFIFLFTNNLNNVITSNNLNLLSGEQGRKKIATKLNKFGKIIELPENQRALSILGINNGGSYSMTDVKVNLNIDPDVLSLYKMN